MLIWRNESCKGQNEIGIHHDYILLTLYHDRILYVKFKLSFTFNCKAVLVYYAQPWKIFQETKINS